MARAQYTRKFVQARFARFAQILGHPVAARYGDVGIALDYCAMYGGYNVVHLGPEGERAYNGWCNRLSGKEICAWMDGAIHGYETCFDKTSDKLIDTQSRLDEANRLINEYQTLE